jgi:hypothetical protein
LESDFGREEVEKERVRHVEVRFRSLAYEIRGPMVSRKKKGGTSGCQNLWRKAEFQCTVTCRRFVK